MTAGKKGTYVPRGDQGRLENTKLKYAFGHAFNEQLLCDYCNQPWEAHQRVPEPCRVRGMVDTPRYATYCEMAAELYGVRVDPAPGGVGELQSGGDVARPGVPGGVHMPTMPPWGIEGPEEVIYDSM